MPKAQDDYYLHTTTRKHSAYANANAYRKQKRVEKRKNRRRFVSQLAKNSKTFKMRAPILKYIRYARADMLSCISDSEQSHSAPNNISQTTEMDSQSYENFRRIIQQYREQFQEDVLVNRMEDCNIDGQCRVEE